MGDKLRIYIGGLGGSVMEDDLKKTFSSPQLGVVESVEIIRSKGRSFAYIEFSPASDKGLAKLFSTYNGCMWKGGRLRLEKAREHYLLRLKREWAEDPELLTSVASQNVAAVENMSDSQKPNKDQNLENVQLRIFFPKLGKIKPVPLKGTGKHKYSFQRVDVPALPRHFCDCEEHSGHPNLAVVNFKHDRITENDGVNEEELNMMKAIMDKFLKKESSLKIASSESKHTKEAHHLTRSVDDLLVDKDVEDQHSDEDNLVINMVAGPNDGNALFRDWKDEVLQDSLLTEPRLSYHNPYQEHTTQGMKVMPNKKRREVPIPEERNMVKKARKSSSLHVNMDKVPSSLNTQPNEAESRSKPSHPDTKPTKTSSWRNLISEKGKTAFHISDITKDIGSKVEVQAKANHPSLSCLTNEEEERQSNPPQIADITTNLDPKVEVQPKANQWIASCLTDEEKESQSSQSKELEILEIDSDKASMAVDKSSRGASWLQKSSWTQLVGETKNNSFSLSQILPGVAFEKQNLPQVNTIDFTSSRNAKQHKWVDKDKGHPVRDVDKPHVAIKDPLTAPDNINEDSLTKDHNHAGVEAQSNSSGKQIAQQELVSKLAPARKFPLKNNSISLGGVSTSETCPFMKNAASMKEWMKTKAALSGSLKKKETE